ncbi:putative mitochondrial carrier [Smittium mucronatum]|uniref:Putative mitochondrial carrier n=1 Tax=Smittium mucronatum TaxID=133383 RepID=A0A1R0H1U9_9FUNG|nr:putative mitochondrial carrier [Smittium mucronatum]
MSGANIDRAPIENKVLKLHSISGGANKETRKLADNGFKHFVAGGVGGISGAILTAPLDVVRTRLQSSAYSYSAVTSTGSRISSSAFQFKTFFALRLLAEKYGDSSYVHLASAMTSGLTTAVLTNPIWMVKTRMQLAHYRSSYHCLVQILANEGVRGLYKGMSASMLGIAEISIHFVLYEKFKQLADNNAASSSAGIFKYFGAAATAKLVASIIAYPHEVARTRMRQVPTPNDPRYTGLVSTFRTIWRLEGVAGLYSGLSAHLMRTVPNAAVMFMAYEIVLDLL